MQNLAYESHLRPARRKGGGSQYVKKFKPSEGTLGRTNLVATAGQLSEIEHHLAPFSNSFKIDQSDQSGYPRK